MCGDHFSFTNSYPWAIASSFISSAPLIKYCPNTGWHTSLSFTLAQVYSTQSPLITSASVIFFPCDSWEATDATFYRKRSHLTCGTASLITCSHNTRQTAWRVHFHVCGWKVICLVQRSPVSSSMACLLAICHHICVFLPATLFSPPRRIKSIHHPGMLRPQILLQHAVSHKNHSSTTKIHQFKGKTQAACDSFCPAFAYEWIAKKLTPLYEIIITL